MASKPINIRKSADERRSEDNDRPMLSEGTMAALHEFLAESQATSNGAQNPFAENWGLSQVHSFLPQHQHFIESVEACMQD